MSNFVTYFHEKGDAVVKTQGLVYLLPVLAILSLHGFQALAVEEPANKTETQANEVIHEKNAVPGSDEVDDIITNNNLRAYSGSKSRWSFASQFNYEGGTISSPLSQDRPNISDASGTTTKSDLDGAVSAKLNLTAVDSVMAGFGLRWIAPLTRNGPTNYNGTTFDVMNPYVQYQHIYKWLGIQSVLQFEVMQWTQADQTAVGYGQQFNIDQENMYEIGKTGISVGASVFVQYQLFHKSGAYLTPDNPNYIDNVASVQSVYSFGISPELEYQLTDKIDLRTLISPATFEHYGNAEHFYGLTQDTVYQSIGVGFSVTRDIFLYPNLQFLPAHLQASLTNIGLGATINLF
jgi:hypothetical protein